MTFHIPHRRLLMSTVVVAVLGVAVWIRCGALPPGLLDTDTRPSVTIVDRHGTSIYEVRSALGLRGGSIDAVDVPPLLAQATLAAEDARFRWHPGLDPIAIVRAAVRNIRSMAVVEGGSTITQQVAKLLLARQRAGVVPPRGWRAKLHEALVALRLEHRLTKDEILALYVTHAPYGNQIAGAERAARAYFGRSAATLTAAEAAYLAALPQQPSRFNPWRSPDRARARQLAILRAMHGRGWLSDQALAVAEAERVAIVRDRTPLVAGHFVERVLAHPSTSGARRIETTLDLPLQRTVQGIIAAEAESLRRHHAANVAIAILDNRSGEWLAWEGSGRYDTTDEGAKIDGVVTPRQPGSALKPFTYAAAFERGLHPGHSLPDVPSEFPTAEPGILYSPRNYDGRFRGPLLARAALAGSENVPAVALASEIGVPTIARLLRRAGITTLGNNAAHYGLGLTLGNAEVRLDELVTAYAMFARGGERLAPAMIRSIDGRRRAELVIERTVSDETAFWIADVLSDGDARAYAFGRGGSLDFPFTVAAKTGTSQSYFDNWVVGFTRDVTVGVWVGNFDRTPLRYSSGITGAGPIFHAAMLAAVERVRGSIPVDDRTPIVQRPHTLVESEICAHSGMAAGDACPTRVREWIPTGTASGPCDWHHATDRGLVTVWPERYRDWARGVGLIDERSVAVEDSGVSVVAAASTARRETLEIVRPLRGALFLIDPTLRPEFQALVLGARGATGPLEWRIDGDLVGTADRDEPVRWPLRKGRHEIVVTDTQGREDRSWIDVR